MLEEVLGQDRTHIVANPHSQIQAHELKQLNTMIKKRSSRMPLAYITGFREFYRLDFKVDESVLIPRPETEYMVEFLIKYAPSDSSMLELGTGSGAIAVALGDNRPDICITATDVSLPALNIAKINAQKHGVDVRFIQSDLFNAINKEGYDVIAANLPYVPTPARRQPEIAYEPDISLYSGEDGLDHYRRFFEQLSNYTHRQSIVVIEFSPIQFCNIRDLAYTHQLNVVPITEYIYRCSYIDI